VENNPIAQWIGIIVGSMVLLLVLWDLYFNEHDPDDHDVP
jgi:glycerol uptake facilitator-like aquaporin